MDDIRWMIRRDVPRVMEIERQCFQFPWSEDELTDQLRERNCIGMVILSTIKIAGYMVYTCHSHRMELINLAVAPEFQRQGFGTRLVDKLKGKMSQNCRNRMFVEVPESNLDAQLFWKSQGFFAVEVLQDWYESEDGYRFRYDYSEVESCLSRNR